MLAGLSIILEGIKIPSESRWNRNGTAIPLEHGFRFYTSCSLDAAMQFAENGIILKFKSPFPSGIAGEIDSGPGDGFRQISFAGHDLKTLFKSLNQYSIDGGESWLGKKGLIKAIQHKLKRKENMLPHPL